MGNFREGSRGGFNRNRSSGSFRGGFGGGGRDRGDRGGRGDRDHSRMYNVVCSKCGSRCQVPFKPTGEKPVFCSDCFRQNEGSSNNFRPGNARESRQSEVSGGQLNEINAKLDKILLVLQNLEIDTSDDLEEDSEDD